MNDEQFINKDDSEEAVTTEEVVTESDSQESREIMTPGETEVDDNSAEEVSEEVESEDEVEVSEEAESDDDSDDDNLTGGGNDELDVKEVITDTVEEVGEVVAEVADAAVHKAYAVVAYIPAGFLVSLVKGKGDEFTTFHAKQAVVGFMFLFACLLLGYVIRPLLMPFLAIGVLANAVAAYQAFKGKAWKLPVIGKYTEKLNFLD